MAMSMMESIHHVCSRIRWLSGQPCGSPTAPDVGIARVYPLIDVVVCVVATLVVIQLCGHPAGLCSRLPGCYGVTRQAIELTTPRVLS